MYNVSYFKPPITNRAPERVATLRQVVAFIRSDKLKSITEEGQTILAVSPAKYKDFKAKTFPYITPSGVFSQRRNEGLKEYSGVVCLDFDHLGRDLAPIRSRIVADPQVPIAMVFRSPSMEGLKVFVRALDQERHTDYYRALLTYFEQTYNLRGDATQDLSRACFLAYDPDVYFNPDFATDPRVFPYEEYKSTTRTVTVIRTYEASESALRLLQEVRNRVVESKVDITSDYNTEYFPLVSGVAKDCGEEGREDCRAICMVSPKYNPVTFDDYYSKRVNDGNNKHTIGTFLYLARKYNISFNKLDATIATSSSSDRRPLVSEQGKLLAIIIREKEDALIEAMTVVKPEYLFDVQLRAIYEALVQLLESGRSFTTDNIAELLPSDDDNRILAKKRLLEFGWSLEPQDTVGDISRRVKYNYADKTTNDKIKKLASSDASLEDKLRDIEGITAKIEEMQAEQENFTAVGDEIPDLLAVIRRLNECDGGITGLASGYSKLDSVTAGFQPATMVVIAGRPGQGKTALAMSMAKNIAGAGHPIAFFSLEMSKRELLERLVSNVGGLSHKDLRSGQIPYNSEALTVAMEKIKQFPLYIFDGGLTFQQLRAKCLYEKRKHNIELVIVDHIGLLQATRAGRSRQEEVGEFSRGLKLLSKIMNIPILVLCQLNRGNVMRANKVPMLHDLRESGAIEQDADIVLLVHRPYEVGDVDDGSGFSTKNLAELHIAKHRAGQTMINEQAIRLTFDREHVRFMNDYMATLNPPVDPLEEAKKRGYLTQEEDSSLPF